jgi:hypothetical protein
MLRDKGFAIWSPRFSRLRQDGAARAVLVLLGYISAQRSHLVIRAIFAAVANLADVVGRVPAARVHMSEPRRKVAVACGPA